MPLRDDGFSCRPMRHPPGTAASLALGIIAIIFAWMPLVALPAVLGALVLARRALARSDPTHGNPAATAAQVCALVGFALSAAVAGILFLALQGAASLVDDGGRMPATIPEADELRW